MTRGRVQIVDSGGEKKKEGRNEENHNTGKREDVQIKHRERPRAPIGQRRNTANKGVKGRGVKVNNMFVVHHARFNPLRHGIKDAFFFSPALTW